MQNYALHGYPTPPASPSYDHMRSHQPVSIPFTRVLAPEERLGTLLEGKLRLTDILGTGAYGVVYLAIDIDTGARYAVKCLSKFNSDGTPLERRQHAYQQREIRLHYLASAHTNVVSMLKIVSYVDCTFVILEYCPEGDLFLNITERGHYIGNDELAKKIFLQILDAVEHCHKLGVYHRDLKPENILVTDHGDTVKLADFGLATSDDRSEDYGCGSTFYMSPECLDPSTRKPFYMCAPNDVWSLGVILVNLTCGRNPWKQASSQDSTYRAYSKSPGFLKTILPITDDMNEILARIFNPSPEYRITLAELRELIVACPRLTEQPTALMAPSISPPVTPEQTVGQFDAPFEEAIIDDISDGSTISDLDDDDYIEEQQDAIYSDCSPHTYEPEVLPVHPSYRGQDFVPQHYTGPTPTTQAFSQLHAYAPCQQQQQMLPIQAPMPPQTPCQPKAYFPLWDVVRYVQQGPLRHSATPFHGQISIMPAYQGCY